MIALSVYANGKRCSPSARNCRRSNSYCRKIENQEGVNNCKSIAREADGIMIARGDLGVELPIHHIPVVQRKMLHDIQTIPETFSIVATGLLRSMKHETRPRRAEVSDIATAVWEGADYLMVSDETASSEHPVKAIEILKDTIDFSIKHGPKKTHLLIFRENKRGTLIVCSTELSRPKVEWSCLRLPLLFPHLDAKKMAGFLEREPLR
jgi:pyruvate kinase